MNANNYGEKCIICKELNLKENCLSPCATQRQKVLDQQDSCSDQWQQIKSLCSCRYNIKKTWVQNEIMNYHYTFESEWSIGKRDFSCIKQLL